MRLTPKKPHAHEHHAAQHQGHTDEIKALHGKTGAQADHLNEVAEACEDRHKALEKKLRAEIAALRAELHEVSSPIPAPPAPVVPDGDSPKPARASRAKTAAAKDGAESATAPRFPSGCRPKYSPRSANEPTRARKP